MGMPVSVEVVGDEAARGVEAAFAYFTEIDRRFSPYRADSEVAALNRDPHHRPSAELAEILALAERTRAESGGFFDIRRPDGRIDPSGIVKGWVIQKVAETLTAYGYEDFCVDAGGDIALSGKNARGESWRIGIRNPFRREEVVRVVASHGGGIATSGSAARGDHIYNPHKPEAPIRDVASITVVAEDVLTADRYATAAFAMGADGILFIETIPGCEAYQIGQDGVAVMTSGFSALARA